MRETIGIAKIRTVTVGQPDVYTFWVLKTLYNCIVYITNTSNTFVKAPTKLILLYVTTYNQDRE